MCKRRWRPYMIPSPAKILSSFGPELGQAILNKDINAVSEIAIAPGKWIVLVGGTIYPFSINSIIIPTVFPTAQTADQWLQQQIPLLDLRQLENTVRSAFRIAYRTYSPLSQEYLMAEAVLIREANMEQYRTEYRSFSKSIPSSETEVQ